MFSVSQTTAMLRNYLILFFFIGLCRGDGSTNKTITDETLRKLLDFFKLIASQVEPIPDINYITNNSQMFVNASVKNAQIEDIRNFDVLSTHADMENLNFIIQIVFPSLNVSGDYSVYSDSSLFQLVGSGPFRIDVKKLLLAADLKLALKEDKTLFLEHLLVEYEEVALNISFANLGGNEEVSQTLNDLINVATPEILTALKPDVQAAVEKKAKQYGSFIFGGMSVQQFVDFIYSFVPNKSYKMVAKDYSVTKL